MSLVSAAVSSCLWTGLTEAGIGPWKILPYGCPLKATVTTKVLISTAIDSSIPAWLSWW